MSVLLLYDLAGWVGKGMLNFGLSNDIPLVWGDFWRAGPTDGRGGRGSGGGGGKTHTHVIYAFQYSKNVTRYDRSILLLYDWMLLRRVRWIG